MSECEIVKKGRGCNLLYNGFSFKKDRAHKNKQHWRCTVHGCAGRVHTSETNGLPTVIFSTQHSHMPDEEALTSSIAKSVLCQQAAENPCSSLRQVYRQYVTQHSTSTETVVPNFSACRSMMNRARLKQQPPLPTTREDIQLTDTWASTVGGQPFVLHQSDSMLIFTTTENLRVLAASANVFMDGTFKSCPKLYSQLYTIHAIYKDHFVPLVYCLLPNKHRDTYYEVLNVIKREMGYQNLVFCPAKIFTDFEAALMPTLRSHFPTSTHKGCYFHFTQAIWRQVQSLGLSTDYNNNASVKKSIRVLMATAFLPLLCVRPAVDLLESDEIVASTPALARLFAYFRSTWLTCFPPAMWNVFNEGIRTNNQVEGWHNKLNRSMGRIHPNIYQFVTCIKNEQAETELTMQRARLGAAPPPRRPKHRILDERLERLRTQFQAGDLDVQEYFSSVRHIVHHY